MLHVSRRRPPGPSSIARSAAVYSMYVGEGERIVREVFMRARRAAPAVVLLDEIDGIATRRSVRLAPRAPAPERAGDCAAALWSRSTRRTRRISHTGWADRFAGPAGGRRRGSRGEAPRHPPRGNVRCASHLLSRPICAWVQPGRCSVADGVPASRQHAGTGSSP